MATDLEIVQSINRLTRRQREHLDYMIAGLSAREVPQRTGLSVNSVVKIRARTYERLGLDVLTAAQRQMKLAEFARVLG